MTHSAPEENTANARYDCVIAGGGFAGMSLAKALADGLGSRARIALVVRDTHAPRAPAGARAVPDSRAAALSAASVRMLTRLGAWQRCADQAQPVTAIDITDSPLHAGIRPVLLSYDNHLGGGEAASHIVPNGALEAALHEAVASAPAITIVPAATVTASAPGPAATTVTLSTGRTLETALLVAADGARSAVRDSAGIKTTGWSYAQTGITVTVAHDRPHGGRAVQHFLPGGPFALLPLPGDRTCITWSERTEEAERVLALDDAGFLAALDARVGGRLGTLRLDGPRQSWPLALGMARSFIGPRLALVGDAAHSVHPIAGQGLNLGLRDVAALAEVVVDASRLGLDIGQPATLERYERWRRFDTMTSAAGFDALNRLFSTQGNVRRAVREFGLSVVDRLPGLKERLVKEAAGVSGTLPRLMQGEAL